MMEAIGAAWELMFGAVRTTKRDCNAGEVAEEDQRIGMLLCSAMPSNSPTSGDV